MSDSIYDARFTVLDVFTARNPCGCRYTGNESQHDADVSWDTPGGRRVPASLWDAIKWERITFEYSKYKVVKTSTAVTRTIRESPLRIIPSLQYQEPLRRATRRRPY